MDSTDCTKNENIQDGDSGYYLTANNSGKLNEIFDNIYREITNTSTNMSVSHELGEDTVVKDVISKYFAGTDEDSVNVYTAEYNGKDSDGKDQWGEYEELEGASVTVSEDGKTVSVSGFDFSENYVGTVDEVVIGETKSSNPHGKKLVIEFTVKPEADFWGGNGVPTNEETSGVYKDEDETTPLTPFDVPTVDVPLNIPTPTAKDVYVYYNGSTPIASDLASVTIPSGNDAWKVAFVDPVLSISSGTVSNTENDTYKVTLTVTPKNKDKDGNKTSASTSCDANVTILVPKVTFTDSTIYLSQQVESFLPSSVSWVKLGADGKATENSAEAASTIIGTAPTLSYTYSTLPGAFTDCTTVTPTVSCGTAVCAAAVANDFTVHVLKPTITFKDSTVYYGDVYTDTNYAQNLVSTTWADANENHTATATSTAPDIVYTYATNPTTYLTGGLINTPNDITVTVTATAGNTDVSSYVAHQDCTGKTSEVTSSNQFIVHVKTCTLTIKNNVTGTSGDDTAFLFKVSGGAFELKDLPVVVTGDSVKITGLPVGTYTVTADDGWSWRYNVTSNSENTSMSSAKPDGVVTFTNTLKNPYWLSGSDRAVNVWSKDGDKEKVVRQSTTTTTTTN
jgi:hypothetical protein